MAPEVGLMPCLGPEMGAALDVIWDAGAWESKPLGGRNDWNGVEDVARGISTFLDWLGVVASVAFDFLFASPLLTMAGIRSPIITEVPLTPVARTIFDKSVSSGSSSGV
jgi:hypothetical protein